MKNFIICLCFLLVSSQLWASKLIDVRIIDKDYILVIFRDGEVVYRDDASGASAYTGHDYAPGDDSLIIFGKELDVDIASLVSSWTITSAKDKNYGRKGRQALAVHRKSKLNNTDHNWNYRLDHWMFLKLPFPLRNGLKYSLEISPKTGTDKTSQEFHFDIFSSMSEAVHVNMIGYTPSSPVKSADLYLWMGDGGQRDYSSFEGNTVWLIEVKSGERFETGKVTFWRKAGTGTEAEGRNLTGSDVWNADFTGFNRPGRYRLAIDGVGCSQEFEISDDAYALPYKTSVRGYYYMRIGEDRMDLVPVPRRPLFIPDKDPAGFTVYITDLHPYHPVWRARRGDTWDEPHFKPAKESLFWQHRLPGNPVNPNAFGGHSDALDWDRHLAHVSDIYDLLLPFLITNGRLCDDNLNTGDSGNGIPDIIDEARNETDLWLRLRHGEGYAHGLTNPSSERTIMFQAGNTNMAAWANAANCAMMAESFRILGLDSLKEYYQKEAIKAFNYAKNDPDQMLDVKQDIGDGYMRGRDFMMMAAAYLYNVTGDRSWEDIMASECIVKDENSLPENRKEGVQIWGTAAYLFCPHERHYPDLYRNMKSAVRNQAMNHNMVHMETRPSRRTSNDNYWQTPHNLHLVILAHAISENEAEKKQFEKAMFLEADWGLGRNPTNTVEMTGLGERHIVNCYTSGRNDGTPGLHPGHTPYNNLDPWGTDHNGHNPQWFVQKCYPEWISGGWPHQEAFFNCRYVWANGEFTPRQTMRGKMALYAYLFGIR